MNNNLDAIELSDVTLEINIDEMNDICDALKQKIAAIDINSINVTEVFSALNNSGIAVSYITSLNNSLNQATNTILSVSNMIKESIDEQMIVDDSYDKSVNAEDNDIASSSNSNSSNSSNSQINIDETTSANNNSTDLHINNDLIIGLENLDLINFFSVMSTLKNISTDSISLDSYLTNENYSKYLKEIILSSNISEDLKNIVFNLDAKTIQITLKEFFYNNKNVFTNVSKSITYHYLNAIANSKGITLNEFINNNYTNDVLLELDDASTKLENAILDDNLQTTLLSIYDGNTTDISNYSIEFIKKSVDVVASKNNISVETLLNSENYKNMLNDEFVEISKATSMINNIGLIEPETSKQIVANLLVFE